MGRKKKYNESAALEKAMFLFWRRGYEAVSIRELADAMEINSFSLYASFESKEALFERSLAHYYRVIFQDWLGKPLTDPNADKKSLRNFFETFVNPGSGKYPAGCLICNTMISAEGQSPEVQAIIDQYQKALSAGFADIIRRDFPQASALEVESKASLLLCLMVGIAAKKRNGFEGHPVQIVVDEIIKFIYPEE